MRWTVSGTEDDYFFSAEADWAAGYQGEALFGCRIPSRLEDAGQVAYLYRRNREDMASASCPDWAVSASGASGLEIGRDSRYVYFLWEPTDVQFDLDDPQERSLFAQTTAQALWLADSFLLENGLTANPHWFGELHSTRSRERLRVLMNQIQVSEEQVLLTLPAFETEADQEPWHLTICGQRVLADGTVENVELLAPRGGWQDGETYAFPLDGLRNMTLTAAFSDELPVTLRLQPATYEKTHILEQAERFGAAVPENEAVRAAFAAQADQWGAAQWVRAETPLETDGLGQIVLPLRTEDGGIAPTETEALIYDPDTGLVTPRYYAWRLLNENWKEASCGAVQTLLDNVLLEVDRAFIIIPAEAAQWEIAIGAERYNGGGVSFPQFRPPLGRWEPGQTYVLELDGIQRATLTATLPGQDPYSFCFQRLDTSQLSRTQPERLQARLRTAFTVAEWTEEELDRLAERLPDLDDWMTDTVWILEREPDQLLLFYVNQEDRMEVRDMDGAVRVLPQGGAEWLVDPSQIEPWLGATVDEDWWSREGAAILEAFAACLQTAPEVLEYNPVWRVEMLGEEVWLYLFFEWDGYFNSDLLIWQPGQEVCFAASGPLIRAWYLVYD